MAGKLPDQSKKQEGSTAPAKKEKISVPEVFLARSWKDYLGESLLIIFSVVLALAVTEFINKRHEKQHTREILGAVKMELINNNQGEKEQYQYHLQVLRNIDSALVNPTLQHQFINSGVINMETIIPKGVMRYDLSDVAWQVAKQNNIFSKIDLNVYTLLTDIYEQQARIIKTEPEVANVLLSRESRTASDNRITLILLRDNYHGWAVDRVPPLLEKYKKAINALERYKE